MRALNATATAILIAATPAGAFAQQPTATSTQPATTSITVDEFAQAAAQNSLSEVLLSTMALQKSNDKRVDDQAWTMLDHHSRAMGDLADALSPDAAALPSEPSAEQKAVLQRMQGLQGTEFDQAYFQHQMEAHEKAIEVFEQAGNLDDQSVANYARVTLPILQAHQSITEYRMGQDPQPMPGK